MVQLDLSQRNRATSRVLAMLVGLRVARAPKERVHLPCALKEEGGSRKECLEYLSNSDYVPVKLLRTPFLHVRRDAFSEVLGARRADIPHHTDQSR